ncbi:MAG: choice-of-anchor U domain-containing protein [Mariprofundaceae bacterium]
MPHRFLSMFFALLLAALLASGEARAWTQRTLPSPHGDSQTALTGGNRAPLVAGGDWLLARVTDAGAAVWTSTDRGASWAAAPLNDPGADQARLLSPDTAITWARHRGPVVHARDAAGNWKARSTPADWPLSASWMMDALVVRGEVWMLATVPDAGRIVEGALRLVRFAGGVWQMPVVLGRAGHARLAMLDNGMVALVQAERDDAAGGGWTNWRLTLRTSADGIVWSAPVALVTNLRAPTAQEAAVQLALAPLSGGRLAVAFTGWAYRPHNQLWVKVCDASSGVALALDRMPDAGDMVFSPSLAALPDGRLAVAWQQRIGMDTEILLAEQDASGAWGAAVAVSADPLHLDRDPHLHAMPAGAASPLLVAWTRADAPGAQEWFRLAWGDAGDPPLDSDGDGMPDTQEAGQDMDGDGVDDAYSDKVATWATPAGRIALALESAGGLRRVQSLTTVPVVTSGVRRTIGDPVSFEVHGVGLGGRALVHLMTPWRLPDDAEWLKRDATGRWMPSDALTAPDGTEHGIRIELIDGGAGDEDGLADGVIHDPGVIGAPVGATTRVDPVVSAAGGGGGCLVTAGASSGPWIGWMLTVFAFWMATAGRGMAAARRAG